MTEKVSPLADQTIEASMPVNVPRLGTTYFTCAYQLCHPNVLLMETVEPRD